MRASAGTLEIACKAWHAMSTFRQSPTQNKNTVIPGYQGHLPKLYVENIKHGKRITEQTREIFNGELDDETRNKINNNLNTTM